MRHVFQTLILIVTVGLGASLLGCAGSAEEEVLDYDPEVTEKQSAEYQKEMEEAMKKQGRKGK